MINHGHRALFLCNSNPESGLDNRFSRLPRQNHLWVRIKYQSNDSCAKSSWVVFYLPFECKQIVKGEILRCSKCFWIGRESGGFYFLAHRALNEVSWKVRTFFKFSVVGMPFFTIESEGINFLKLFLSLACTFGASHYLSLEGWKTICEFFKDACKNSSFRYLPIERENIFWGTA